MRDRNTRYTQNEKATLIIHLIACSSFKRIFYIHISILLPYGYISDSRHVGNRLRTKAAFHTKCVGTFVIYLRTKLDVPNSIYIYWLLPSTKNLSKVFATAMLLFFIRQKDFRSYIFSYVCYHTAHQNPK